ncbi:MAG TPA: hypothetical protein ENJ54_03480 [Chloroflexi bacterium]|nr:hypothetical protein [Chloroflexota bacterium]
MTTNVLSPRARERQVRRYWTEDGFAELVIGVGFVGLAVLLWLSDRSGAAQARLWGVVQAVYILAFAWGTRWVVQRLKWRVTYPRTGYVAYPRQWLRRRVVRFMVLAVGVAGVIGLAGLVLLDGTPRLYLLALTLGLAGLYLGLAWAQDWGRGVGYAVVVLLSGGAAWAWWHFPFWGAWSLQGGLHFATLGVAQTLGGAWTLWRYLRRHPRPIEEET